MTTLSSQMLKYNDIAVLYAAVFQRFLIFSQRLTVVDDQDLRRGETGFDFTEGFETFEFQVFADIQNENIIGQSRNRHFHLNSKTDYKTFLRELSQYDNYSFSVKAKSDRKQKF